MNVNGNGSRKGTARRIRKSWRPGVGEYATPSLQAAALATNGLSSGVPNSREASTWKRELSLRSCQRVTGLTTTSITNAPVKVAAANRPSFRCVREIVSPNRRAFEAAPSGNTCGLSWTPFDARSRLVKGRPADLLIPVKVHPCSSVAC